MHVCRRVYLRLLQDSIELFPALNHPLSHCPHKRTRNLHTPMLFHIHYSVDTLNTYIHILHTRISDKNKVKNLVVMICMHVCMFVCPIRIGFEIQPNRQFAERRFKSCEGVDQPSRHHPIDLYYARDEVRRCVSTGSAMVPP